MTAQTRPAGCHTEAHADADAGQSGPNAQGQPVMVLGMIYRHSPLVLLAHADRATQWGSSLAGGRVMIEPAAMPFRLWPAALMALLVLALSAAALHDRRTNRRLRALMTARHRVQVELAAANDRLLAQQREIGHVRHQHGPQPGPGPPSSTWDTRRS